MLITCRSKRTEERRFLVAWALIGLGLGSATAFGGFATDEGPPPATHTVEERPALLRQLQGQLKGQVVPAISRDGSRVAAGTGIAVTIWDAGSGQILRTFGDSDPVDPMNDEQPAGTDDIAISPDGDRVATSGAARIMMMNGGISRNGVRAGAVIKLWDVPAGRLIRSIDPGSTTEAMSFGDRGRTLVAVISGQHARTSGETIGFRDFKLTKVRWQTGYRYGDLAKHTAFSADALRSACFRQSDDRVAADLFDVATGRATALGYEKMIGSPQSIAVTDDGKRVAIVSSDHSLTIWDFESAKLLRFVPSPQAGNDRSTWPLVLAFDSKGRRIAAGSADGVVRIWDDDGSDRPSRTIAGPAAPVRGIVCPEGGFRVVSGGCLIPGVYVGIPKISPLTVWDVGPGPQP